MKILLVAPPVFDFYFTTHRMEPLGLLYIREALEKAGHEATLYDATLSGKVKRVAMPPEFSYLEKFYEEDMSPFSLHNGYKRLGDSFLKIVDFIKENNFDFVALSSLFSPYHPDVELLAAEIKKSVDIPVVTGGTAINAQKKGIAGNTNADYLVCGNGAVTLPLLADAINRKISFEKVPGLIYRKDDGIIFNEPSFDPAWCDGLIPKREKLRLFRKRKIAKIIFSAGCRNRCAFCSIHRDNRLAFREISHIKRELEYLSSIGAEVVDIEDDDIFSNGEYTSKILDILEEMHTKGLCFTAMNGLTARNILPFAERLVSSGFIKLDLSLVSAEKNVAKGLHRPHGITEIEEIIRRTEGETGIEVFLIPGLPGTELRDTFNTLLHLNRLGVKGGLSPLYLVPGVPMFEEMGIPENVRLCRGSALYPFDDEKRANVASLLKVSRFLNYSLDHRNDENYSEFLHFFNESLKRGRWFRLDKGGNWCDSFEFTEKFDAGF
ncbi:cobalamin-dependent protein [bacterium]|nr:cobalamin-dependent protein [bacterium]